MKLRPEVKEKWLRALRSGEYEQAREHLHVRDESGDSFCCLGVLCDLAVKEGVVGRNERDGLVLYDGHDDMPPVSVRAWAFEGDHNPGDSPWDVVHREDGDSEPVGLATLNDEYDMSFDEIANAIEESL